MSHSAFAGLHSAFAGLRTACMGHRYGPVVICRCVRARVMPLTRHLCDLELQCKAGATLDGALQHSSNVSGSSSSCGMHTRTLWHCSMRPCRPQHVQPGRHGSGDTGPNMISSCTHRLQPARTRTHTHTHTHTQPRACTNKHARVRAGCALACATLRVPSSQGLFRNEKPCMWMLMPLATLGQSSGMLLVIVTCPALQEHRHASVSLCRPGASRRR